VEPGHLGLFQAPGSGMFDQEVYSNPCFVAGWVVSRGNYSGRVLRLLGGLLCCVKWTLITCFCGLSSNWCSVSDEAVLLS